MIECMRTAAKKQQTNADWIRSMTDKQGLKLIEIANQLGIAEGTVRSWKNRYKWDDGGNATLRKKEKKERKDDAAMAHLFKQEQSKPPYNPKNGGAGGVTNPFAKDTFNLTEQGRMLKENPAQAKELAAAAGVTL